jgi:hypothetical protein
MDAYAAIAKANGYMAELFADEGITNVGLEGVEFGECDHHRRITIGFSGPWEHPLGIAAAMHRRLDRTYQVVVIDDRDGRVTAVKHRVPLALE